MSDTIVPHVPVDPEELKQIFEALKRRGVKGVCPECGTQRELLPGYDHRPLWRWSRLPPAWMGGLPPDQTVVTVFLVCPRCGHVSEFAHNILTLEPQKTPEAEPPKRHLGPVPMPPLETCKACGKEIVECNTVDDVYSVCETCPQCGSRQCGHIVCPECGFDTAR